MRVPYYEIRISGLLDPSWSEWFDNLCITYDVERGETILSGPVTDQTALYTLLVKARDLSLTLISVGLLEQDDRHISKEGG